MPIRMGLGRSIDEVLCINEMLHQIPSMERVSEAPETYTSGQRITRRKREALESTLEFLRTLILKIKGEQEKYSEKHFQALDERERYARGRMEEIESEMSRRFDKHKVGEIEALLGEIQKYSKTGSRPTEVVTVNKEQSLRIFGALQRGRALGNGALTEYLKRKLNFECEDVTDAELRSLRLLLMAGKRYIIE
jgi:hypothetical protein